MSAARYWRVDGIEAYLGGEVEISAFYLFDSTGRVDQFATLTSSGSIISGDLANLQDGNTATLARFDPRPSGFALVWDFGVGGEKSIDSIAIGSSISKDEYISTLSIKRSSDGISWTPVAFNYGSIDWPGPNAAGLSYGSFDTYQTQVLRLQTQASNGLVDTSQFNRPVLLTGSPSISTAVSRFGAGSLFLQNSSAISIPASSDFSFGVQNFTLECWCYPTQNPIGCALIAEEFIPSAGEQVAFAICFGSTIGATSGSNIFFGLFNGTSWQGTPPAAPLALNQWSHVAGVRNGNLWTLYLNGVAVSSATISTPASANQQIWIGRRWDMQIVPSSNAFFNGYIEDVRILRGVAAYTANFTPPSSLLGPVLTAAPRRVLSDTGAAIIVGEPPVEDVAPRLLLPGRIDIDLQDGGLGRIVGTVKEKSLPVNTPLRRRVALLNERDNRIVRETWSDEQTGAYEFRDIKLGERYAVLGFDHTGTYRAVIADNLQAEPMP